MLFYLFFHFYYQFSSMVTRVVYLMNILL